MNEENAAHQKKESVMPEALWKSTKASAQRRSLEPFAIRPPHSPEGVTRGVSHHHTTKIHVCHFLVPLRHTKTIRHI
jgi:hypothetical protein